MKNRSLYFLKTFGDFLVFSNILVAISVVALCAETMIMFDIFDLKYPAFLFFLTLFVYCFHRAYRLNFRSPKEQQEGRHLWVKENQRLFYAILFSAALGILFCVLFWINLSTLLALLPIAAISLAYSVPFINIAGKKVRLRDIKGIKIFVITLIISLTTVILPLIFYHKIESVSNREIFFVLARRVLFVFAITIPFDIRDMEYDEANNVKTIPIMLGIGRSKLLAGSALLVFIILALVQGIVYGNSRTDHFFSLILSAIITLILIAQTNRYRKELFYPSFIEGTMLLQFFLVVLF